MVTFSQIHFVKDSLGVCVKMKHSIVDYFIKQNEPQEVQWWKSSISHLFSRDPPCSCIGQPVVLNHCRISECVFGCRLLSRLSRQTTQPKQCVRFCNWAGGLDAEPELSKAISNVAQWYAIPVHTVLYCNQCDLFIVGNKNRGTGPVENTKRHATSFQQVDDSKWSAEEREVVRKQQQCGFWLFFEKKWFHMIMFSCFLF